MNANRDSLPIIALVPGDCTGIGPEQTARVLSDDRLADVARLVVVGDARVLEMGMAHAGVKLEVERVAWPAKASFREGVVPLVDLGNTDPRLFPLGKSNAESGRLTGETLSRAMISPGQTRSMPSPSGRSTSARCSMAAGSFPTSTRCSQACSGTKPISPR
jgi:4-hydroxythreonine-4-phosphate dehydrogenase